MSSADNVSLLPDVPLRHVLKYLDYIATLNLSEVSDRLHNFIDNEKSIPHLHGVRIKVYPQRMTLSLSFNEEQNRSRQISIEYENKNLKWEDRWNENKVDIGGDGYLDDFFKDLHIILKHQKNALQTFSFEIRNDYIGKRKMKVKRVCCRFFSELRDSLRTRNLFLQVIELDIKTAGHDQVTKVLPYLDPKILKTIRLTNFLMDSADVFNIDAIINLDQFKQTENFYLENFQTNFLGPFQAFGHLSRFRISLDFITTDDLFALKEALLLNQKFEQCSIPFKHFDNRDFSKLSPRQFEERCTLGERTRWILQAAGGNRALSLTTDYETIVFIGIPCLSRFEYRCINV